MPRVPGFTGTHRTWPVCREVFNSYCIRAGSLIPDIILTGDVTLPNAENCLPGSRLPEQKPARVEEQVQAVNRLPAKPDPGTG